MKKIYFLVSFSIFFLVLVFLSSCRKEQLYDKLIGSWMIETIKDSTGKEIPLETIGYKNTHLRFEPCVAISAMCPAILSNEYFNLELAYKISDDLKSFNLYLNSNSTTPKEYCTIVKFEKNTLIYISNIDSTTRYEFTFKKMIAI